MVSAASLDTNGATIQSQSQGYDTLNRPITSTDSRTGTTTMNYLSNTADIVASASDAGGRTTAFVYDIRGRQISVNAPDTLDSNNQTLTNVTITTYNPDSTVAETNGDQTYRVSHTYDYADRQISMTTYGTATATTTWQYSQTRGFLLAKRDASNKGANYTYKASGRLATRTWARGITITYSYDNGGRMISTNYSDSTPDVTMAYDAMGRQTNQSNGIATSAFAYNVSNLQMDTETVSYSLPGKPAFSRVIDRSQDNLSRDNGWLLKDGTTVDNEVVYSYGSLDGRLSTVSKGTNSFSYLYAPNSSLIASVTSPAHSVSNVYETNRDVLASKVNKKLDTTTVSGYFYTVNNYGQRTGVTTDGTAFTGSPSWAWGYNSKGEVVKADSSEAGLDRAYQYDGIGNRQSGGDLGSPISYTPNVLNQYSAIGSLTPVHDDDGNMTSGPLPANINANSTLIWDGENRLIEAQVNGGNTVNYVYDSQSRRIAETVGSATTVYVYDGWNPIAEYNTTFALTKTYTWGIDLSGSMQGAGGVGGLLSVTDGTGTYFPTFDGNGNVSEYLDSNGNTVAHYEYDPFGKTTVATGSKTADFSHRFSTKPLDVTTGLYYYGNRYYDPETGRWPSRDPIEEEGGLNLYGFVGNDGVNKWDYLGMCGIKCDEELLFWNNAEGADQWRFTSPDGKGFNPWNKAGAEWFAKKRDKTTAMPAVSLDEVIQTIKLRLSLNPDCDCYSRITLAGHGYNISNPEGVLLEKGVAFFGSEPVSMNDKVFLRNSHDKLAEIAKYICPDGVLEIMGCNTMGDQVRIAEMQKLANNIQRKVQGYTGPFEFDILNNLGDQTSVVTEMLNEPGSLTLSPE